MLFHRPALHHRSDVRILWECAAVSSADGAGRVPTGVAQKSHPCGHPSSPFQRRQCAAVSSATRHAKRQVVGVCQCALPLFWLGHFSWAMLFPPTQPPGNPTRAAWMQQPASQGTAYGEPLTMQSLCIHAPRSTGEAVRAAYGRALIVCAVSPPARGRPLSGSRRGKYVSCGLVCARAHGHCFG